MTIALRSLSILLCLLVTLPASAFEQARPNIIIILADDMGYGDLGSYGSHTINTPNLDELAAKGARFEHFYSASPVCSPARAALLTGRYPVRMGIHKVFYPESLQGMDPEEITIAELLRDRGYRNALIGKWHLGHHEQFMPWNQGFDEFFGLPYSNDMGGLYFFRNRDILFEEIDQRFLTQAYTQEALRFIDANTEQPFFLFLSHSMPHVPLYASPDFQGKSEAGLYGDVIEELDWSVGQIIARLKQHAIDDNTLVFFTSDNGPWRLFGEAGGSAGPLRGGKRFTFEGGMRVPAIAYWPKRVPAGTTPQSVASLLDLLPTIAAINNIPLPNDRVIDGQDITPLLLGEEMADRPFFYFMNGEIRAYRFGPWKIKKPFNGELGWLRWLHSGFVAAHGPQLFNLAEDPGESTNLKNDHPQRYLNMLAELEAFETSLGNLPAAKRTGKNTDFSPYISLLLEIGLKFLLAFTAVIILLTVVIRRFIHRRDR